MPRFDHEYGEDFQALSELAEVLTELVTTLNRGGHGDLRCPHLVELANRWMPRAQITALVVDDGCAVRTLAASDPIYEVIDRFRSETGEGPALDVLETNDVVVTDSVADDPRWPCFGPRVSDETGIVSIAAYRVHLGGPHRAALSFYSDWPRAFDDLAIATGAIVAGYASLAFCHSEGLDLGGPARLLRTRERRNSALRAASLCQGSPDLGGTRVQARCGDEPVHAGRDALRRAMCSARRGHDVVLQTLAQAARARERSAQARERLARSAELMARAGSGDVEQLLTRAYEARVESARNRQDAVVLRATLESLRERGPASGGRGGEPADQVTG
jgi:hypothetical protein